MTRVFFRWLRRPSQPTADSLRRVISAVVGRCDRERSEVHVLIAGDEEIRALNREYRGKDVATDVLSFPDGDELPSGRVLLGEIAVSLETARRQAERLGHSELRELQELVIHGTLHLLGFDHSRDQGGMNSLELQIRQEVLS